MSDPHGMQEPGEFPVLAPGYYLVHRAPAAPYVAEVEANGTWWFDGGSDGDERREIADPRCLEGYTLTPLPLVVELPRRFDVHASVGDYCGEPEANLHEAEDSTGIWMRAEDVITALAKAGIRVKP